MDVAGCFSWNAADNMIVLERQGKPAWFFAVGENVLQKKLATANGTGFSGSFVNK